ncbi:hypothetical protein F9B85_02810 [Heliorestis acidaminivorans]|uniref:Uncharacterized protein n=1 Tax=Heliorestis acidaminivorans TaxID=553427 RepID=A0A6I0F3S6_9FIRM|nr:hypothetical protein [Heliorestis acidaminivorans]KAB2954621.1 hypothetical protein F9B85_02810 [Heliorestis acidaminivorans]
MNLTRRKKRHYLLPLGLWLTCFFFIIPSLAIAEEGFEEKIIFSGSQATSFENAILIESLQEPTTIFGNFSSQGQSDFYLIKAQKGEQLLLEMSIPQISRLDSFRPAFFVVGPELPNNHDFPFVLPLPSEYKTYQVLPAEREKARIDSFSGNSYWITQAFQYPIPDDAEYYIIVYDEKKQEGKYQLRIGTSQEKPFYRILTNPIDFLALRAWYNPIQVLIPTGLFAMAMMVFLVNILKRKK